MSSSSIFSTPRSKSSNAIFMQTPTPRRLCRQSAISQETPENIDTPIKRRISKGKLNEISNLLTVGVRIRPMNTRELSCTSIYNTVHTNQNELTVKVATAANNSVGVSHKFQYDYVFNSGDSENSEFASQKSVFNAIGKPMLDNAFKGYNACLFAYGQTGSGKSYSMMGIDIDSPDNESCGIIPRFCYDLFDRIANETSNATVEVGYFEIYNEKIYDLLAIDKRIALKVREHPVLGPYVNNLNQHTVKSFNELKNLLEIGNKFRATAATYINEKSSRSHSIVSIELCICDIDNNERSDFGRRSKINLVDLAGSERVGNSCNEDRHREGVSINQSLLTLGKVITSLAEAKKERNYFIPYRESTLTWLLKESLGGNSLTSMLATITPASSHADETLATLRYACQARSITNLAYVNENPNDRLIRELRAEVQRLRALRQDYERQSLTLLTPTGNTHELNELRQRLNETERNLETAQEQWEQKLRQLNETEKRKKELESHIEVMSNKNLKLSPYKSNFLEEIEELLNGDENGYRQLIEDTLKWCKINDLNNLKIFWDSSLKKIVIKDLMAEMYAICSPNHLENRSKYNSNPNDFLNTLVWINDEDENYKPITKSNFDSSFQQLYNIIVNLKPLAEHDDENVRHSFKEFNMAFKNLKISVNKSKKLVKSVTFKN